MATEWIDISVPIYAGMVHWPGIRRSRSPSPPSRPRRRLHGFAPRAGPAHGNVRRCAPPLLERRKGRGFPFTRSDDRSCPRHRDPRGHRDRGEGFGGARDQAGRKDPAQDLQLRALPARAASSCGSTPTSHDPDRARPNASRRPHVPGRREARSGRSPGDGGSMSRRIPFDSRSFPPARSRRTSRASGC